MQFTDGIFIFARHTVEKEIVPDRYMTTSDGGGWLWYSPISVHELHADLACTTSVQEGGPFR